MCFLLQLLEISMTHNFMNPFWSAPYTPVEGNCVQGLQDQPVLPPRSCSFITSLR